MSINLNLFTRLNDEGGVSQNNKVAFQTMNFTPKTQKDVVDNMRRLEAIAADPNDNSIVYGQPFYLPCVITEAKEASPEAAHIPGIMQVDGTVAETVADVTAEGDEPDF